MEKRYYVYTLSNRHRTVLYTEVTSDLIRRASEHRTQAVPGFSKRYNVDRLVFFEEASDPSAAIAREKQIKGGSRAKKIALIGERNPEWRDLYDDIVQGIASSLRSSQ